MADKFCNMEESFNRLMETVTSIHMGGSNAPKVSRRHKGNHRSASGQQGEHLNLFALAIPNQNVKLEFSRFQGGDPT